MNAYDVVLIAWMAIAIATFAALFFVRAPYGRHIRKGFGPVMPNRLGWLIMEAPASLLMLGYFLLGPNRTDPVMIVFLILWQLHYVHRAFIYPFRIRTSKKDIPLMVVGLAILFNICNTYLNGTGIFVNGPFRSVLWFSDIRFVAGSLVFVAGFAINLQSDHLLRKLRKDNGVSYKVPEGGLFRWVSCPNYLGEIMEWTGWALFTWSLSGLSFAVWTIANLMPRALQHHKWYKSQFPGYPEHRKAILPFVL